MSLVICAATTNDIIIAGDTQINNVDGPLQDTAMKVFPIGKDTLVGITGDYKTYTPVYNFINGRLAEKPTVLKPLS